MFTLDHVVPWGRSYDEYQKMFALSDSELRTLKILGCADGPASFNAEATRRGHSVVSCDPIYQFTVIELRARISATYDLIIEETRANASQYVWNTIASVEELGHVRMAAMRMFLDDYDAGKAEGRYVEGQLPSLPVGDKAFGLALCSHFLFLYSELLGEEFHRAAIRELCRVAHEVRIFPLLTLAGQRSPFVRAVTEEAKAAGHDVVVERVPYEFQRGGNEMMRVGARLPARTTRVSARAARVAVPASSPAAAVSKPIAPAPAASAESTGSAGRSERAEPAQRSGRASKSEPQPAQIPEPAPKAQAAAFYIQLSPRLYRALPETTGPWDPTLQHGGPPAALLGRALERLGGPPGTRIARLAFDFFHPVPVGHVSVDTSVVRQGRKLQISEATMKAAGRVVLRAAAAHVLADAGRSPEVPETFEVPPLPANETRMTFPGLERFEYASAIEWRVVEGDFARRGPMTVWTRCCVPIVSGSTLTGLERVLAAADAANGISAELPIAEWTFVPIDLMVTLLRVPETEWLGMSSRTTIAGDGIGATKTVLFDVAGVLGHALQTLYVTPRERGEFV
jgi:hypothetical protein